jgi:hypothetical protein
LKISLITLCIVLLSVLVGGCQESAKKSNDKSITNDPGYESKEQIPQRNTTTDIRGASFITQAVVTFYEQGGVKYLSKHNIVFSPKSQSLTVSANEPVGKLSWKISGGGFTGPKNVSDYYKNLYNEDTLRIILLAFSAAGGFIDIDDEGSIKDVKIDGIWHKAFEVNYLAANDPVIYIPYNQNRVKAASIETETGKLTARVYNFRAIAGFERFVPGKIDIYQANNDQLVIKISFETIFKK